MRGLSHIIKNDVNRKSLKEMNAASQPLQLALSACTFLKDTRVLVIKENSL